MTPVGLYSQLRDRFPYSLLLESADSRGAENSFSFICFDRIASFEVDSGAIRTLFPGEAESEVRISRREQVIETFEAFRSSFQVQSAGAHPDVAGLFGYTSYDAIEYFEDITLTAELQPESAIPQIRYGFYRHVFAFNHFKDELFLIEHVREGEAAKGGRALLALLARQSHTTFPFRREGGEVSNFTDAEHVEMISICKRHIARGDVFQIVPSRRFSQRFQGDEFNVYRTLRSVNPSPYLFYFDYGGFKIFGSSPEAQLIIRDRKATIFPIAGTSRRSGDEATDLALVEDLKNDPKENAEHVMLVDLARNDLSKHCRDVHVEIFKEVHFYSHVIHLVSKVSGMLREDKSPLSVLGDTFPAGTLSGAPKYKAMQIIDRVERGRRQSYGGCIGFLGFNGDCNHAIVIRSFRSKNSVLYSQAGGGVVFDSSEEAEVQEVRNKLGALKQAIEMAETLGNAQEADSL